MFRIWKYLPTFVFCTFVTIVQQPHHSLLSIGDQSEGIYITQIIRPQIWAQGCTYTNRYIKMGPIKLSLDISVAYNLEFQSQKSSGISGNLVLRLSFGNVLSE